MSVVMALDCCIYRLDAVEATAREFDEWAKCVIQQDEKIIHVELVARQESDLALLARSFANYALAASLAQHVERET